MKKIYIFVLLLFFSNLFSFPLCLNKPEISEKCIDDIFANKNYELVLKFVDQAKISNKTKKTILKIESFFSTSQFKKADEFLAKLPKKLKESLYFRYLKIETDFMRKRFTSVLNELDDLKDDYPLFYYSKNMDCKIADIYLFRNQFDDAVESYDLCLKNKKNEISAFKRIVALEKKGSPSSDLLAQYLDFIDDYRFSFLKKTVVQKLIFLKQKFNVPVISSPFFPRWFLLMKNQKGFDKLFSPIYLNTKSPVDLMVCRYLIKKNRLKEALKIVNRALTISMSKHDLYRYGWQKYRILYKMGEFEKSANYLLTLSKQLSKTKADRTIFFSAIVFGEIKNYKKAEELLSSIVFREKKSKYMLMALYKLGLFYMLDGKFLSAFNLWSNYIVSNINPSRYFNGRDSFRSIFGFSTYLDRLNETFIFSGEDSQVCFSEPDKCGKIPFRFVSYYDFLYYHNVQGEKSFAKFKDYKFNKKIKSLWEKNELKYDDDIVLKIDNLSQNLTKRQQKSEVFKQLKFFSKNRLDNGFYFYFKYLISFRFLFKNSQKLSALLEADDIDSKKKLYFVLKPLFEDFWAYFKVPSKVADEHFQKVKNSLTFSPYFGMENDWKKLYPTPHLKVVLKLAEEFNLPPAFLYSIMRAETYYREDLVSGVGAVGLMQVMPSTFDKISMFSGLKVVHPFNVYENLKVSAWYLSKLLKRFDGNLMLATAGYNAGPKRVSIWLNRYKNRDFDLFVELIPYKETRNYVKKVVRYFEIYSYLYEGKFYDLDLGKKIDVKENSTVVNF